MQMLKYIFYPQVGDNSFVGFISGVSVNHVSVSILGPICIDKHVKLCTRLKFLIVPSYKRFSCALCT
ncbi:hypothetical protein HanIR_Chr09g0445611 [Helianthus annuus]|nr:hypothetical protein HanIR_Chr09g0445611 [Helianthus annuus]